MSMIEALKAYNYNLKASLVVDLAVSQVEFTACNSDDFLNRIHNEL